MTILSKICCGLSVVLLFAIGWQTFYKLTETQYWYLNTLDTIICIFYIIDWVTKLKRAKSKKRFLMWGWVDLLASIPVTQSIWAMYYPALRVIRAFRAVKYIHDFFFSFNKTSKFVDCCIISIFFIFLSAIGVYNCEKHVDAANIQNMSDALWWAMSTITTIGYGDHYPVTDLGRIISSFVMIGGVGLYASFTAFIVSKFIKDDRVDNLISENKDLHKKIDTIIRKLES